MQAAPLPELACLDGMGPAGSNAHSPEEYLEINTCLPCVELLSALLLDLKR